MCLLTPSPVDILPSSSSNTRQPSPSCPSTGSEHPATASNLRRRRGPQQPSSIPPLERARWQHMISVVCSLRRLPCLLRSRPPRHPSPASATTLIEWCAHHHAESRSYSLLKRNLATLKSWHIDLGLNTSAFDSDRLARIARGFKRIHSIPRPTAKLPITLPLLRLLVQALRTVCPSQHDRRMYHAAFCLAFACFLRAGKFTREAQGDAASLTVGSVSFATDKSFATIHLPSSKTDPFRTGATLTAPAIPLSTCAVAALEVICCGRSPSAPLFVLEGGLPFSRSAFATVLQRCLEYCGIQPSAYSSHSFRRGAATWAVANGIDDDTIRALGRWRSDCFHRYIDKSVVERAATARSALYNNTSHHLDLSVATWRDL